MTPPAPALEEPCNRKASILSLDEMSAHLQLHEEETRVALSEITARLDELLGRSGLSTSTTTAGPKLTDAATRHQAYEQSTTRLHEIVQQVIPAGANVLVISKGDDALLRMEGRLARHFPQGPDGRYAGFHPVDSAAALTELENLADKGAEFLVIPATSLWWLEHYRELAEYLSDAFIFRDEATGAICALSQRKTGVARVAGDPSAEHFYRQLRGVVCNLLPPKTRLLVISKGDPELVAFDGLDAAHFPQATNGIYAGCHPADSAAAIAHLEDLRARGAEYLLIPHPSIWWLHEYPGFRVHLETYAHLVSRQRNLGTLYALVHGQT